MIGIHVSQGCLCPNAHLLTIEHILAHIVPHGLVFLLNVWEAFHFAALWAPFVERAGFRAISAVCGVLDSLDMGAFCVALGCVVRGYRMCDCFRGIVEFHYFTNTSVILTKYIICLWGPVFG